MASPVAAGRDWGGEHWVGTWAASPHAPSPGFQDFPSQIIEFDNQTVRQIVRASVGGDRARIRLANTFGEIPLVIGAAHIALRDAEAHIVPDSDRALTFSGNPGITIPPGALALSDPVTLDILPLAELAVSVYLPEPTTSTTTHSLALQTNYVAPEGDVTAEVDMPVDETMPSWVFLTGVDVAAADPTGVVVTLGDSITDGYGSTPETYRRWPDVLAERLATERDEPAMAVLNAGINGNRLLHDDPGEPNLGFGPSALARLDRDVLARPGVTHLIVFEGINDIGLPLFFGGADQAVSAAEMIGALRQIAERAHERGIVVLGATITPFGGSAYFTPEGEDTRQAVNTWIRSGGAFDAVLDFDAVVRDPNEPARLLAAYDTGDHLHMNDAGYTALADSIDLSLFVIPARG